MGQLFEESLKPLAYGTVSVQEDDTSVYVRIVGEVDMAINPELAAAAEKVRAMRASMVVLDIASVTFADSTLANFVMRMRCVIPDGARLLVCRATPATRRLLEVASVDTFAVLCDDLPLSVDAR